MHKKHVPSPEHCQELDRLCKEKNITIPETEFYWYKLLRGTWTLQDMCWCDAGYVLRIPAPLVSEQGECLPQRIAKNKGQQIWALQCFKKMHNGKEEWFTRYENVEGTGFLNMQDPTEANARQKMLNYLIAEGIITKL